jgi:hypothetical protein
VWGANIHFSTDGNDSTGDGSVGTPYKTTNKFNDLAVSPGFSNGDEIRFECGDTFNNANGSTEALGNDGSKINFGGVDNITITRYGTCTGTESPYVVGNDPIFDADELQPVWLSLAGSTGWVVKHLYIQGSGHAGHAGRALFEVEDATDFTMRYSTVDGHANSTSYKKRDRFVAFDQMLGNTQVLDSDIKNNYDLTDAGDGELTGWTSDGHLLFLDYETDAAGFTTTGTFLISGNTFSGSHADSIQGWLFDSASRGTITNNTFSSWGENAHDLKAMRHVDVHSNTYNRTWTTWKDANGDGSPDSQLSAIIVQSRVGYGVSDDVNIYNNYFLGQNDDRGITSGYNTTSLSIYNNRFEDVGTPFYTIAINGVDFYNNVIFVDTNYTQHVGKGPVGSLIFIDNLNVDNVDISNNSIYLGATNNTNVIEWQCDSAQSGNSVANNAIHIADADSVYGIELTTGCTTEQPTFSNNAIYNSLNANRTSMEGTVYNKTEQAAYRSAWDSDSLLFNTGTPGLSDPANGDLWPANSSSALIDVGSATYAPANGLQSTTTWTPTISIDEIARPQEGGDDIGAYEGYHTASVEGLEIK